MNTTNRLTSLGAAFARQPFMRSLTAVSLADALGWVGLQRRPSPTTRTLERVALVGMGAALGAGAALLLAPANGSATRQQLTQKAKKLVTKPNRRREIDGGPVSTSERVIEVASH